MTVSKHVHPSVSWKCTQTTTVPKKWKSFPFNRDMAMSILSNSAKIFDQTIKSTIDDHCDRNKVILNFYSAN